MLQFETILELDRHLRKLPAGATIGFVPTMGALHKGHLSLIHQSKAENDITICSVFVNPIQFNNPEDLRNYPRNIERDAALLESGGCDVLFAPSREEMYPSAPKEQFDFGILETVMEGKFRPGHFNGVAIVVNRFFEIIRPDRAYFGEKDFQQLAVIRELVKKTGKQVKIISCATIREESGLAISSRNQLLSSEEKKLASNIYQWLKEVAAMKGKLPLEQTLNTLREKIRQTNDIRYEYLEVAHPDSLQPLPEWPDHEKCICCIAVYVGKVRLIDNLLF